MIDARTRFLQAVLWHGTLDDATAMLAVDPSLAERRDIHVAAVLGNAELVGELLATDPGLARATAPPYGGDPLTYLCLSRFLRLEPARSECLVRTARMLLDAGADPNGGFTTTGPRPERETALYGAAGVAHHPGLTALLLERGADPNDEEVVYHSPEGDDSRAMQLVVETGKVTAPNLALMLVRKADWHDPDGVRYLLEKGADPNLRWHDRGLPPLHHAVQRDNIADTIALMLDYGGNPAVESNGRTAIERAARRGRGDLLELFAARGMRVDLEAGVALMAACARNEALEAARAGASARAGLLADGHELLTEFAANGNAAGVSLLLALGVPVDARYPGDGYWELAPGSTALHAAAWRLRELPVRVLLAAGADLDARDDRGRTPLELAVAGCTRSYWAHRRSSAIAAALLGAGASPRGIAVPTGYAALDTLLDRA